ncbi:hypothetical protein RFI_33855 [Reticulomyxa filosa]|uniref:Uncharacterized protein n=1 Tax=Reticulomyxa filosa TaxID=46433 RepID=X6LQ81_RETFI|nr:hypothetical protein RFI_33855 [Reticulomyxa filosa]|eukprot:ETO03546.1 hypothetical protein RFI_33855 [Reticulomyxa filosa]
MICTNKMNTLYIYFFFFFLLAALKSILLKKVFFCHHVAITLPLDGRLYVAYEKKKIANVLSEKEYTILKLFFSHKYYQVFILIEPNLLPCSLKNKSKKKKKKNH